MAPRCTQLPQQPGGEHQRGAPRLCPRSQPGPEICLFQSTQGLATGCRGSFLVFLSAMRGWGAAAWSGMQRGSGEAGKRGAGGHRGVPGDPGSAGSVQIAPEGHSGGGRGAASRRPGAGSGPCPAGPRRARGSTQGFFPLHCIVKLACGNLTCSLCWSWGQRTAVTPRSIYGWCRRGSPAPCPHPGRDPRQRRDPPLGKGCGHTSPRTRSGPAPLCSRRPGSWPGASTGRCGTPLGAEDTQLCLFPFHPAPWQGLGSLPSTTTRAVQGQECHPPSGTDRGCLCHPALCHQQENNPPCAQQTTHPTHHRYLQAENTARGAAGHPPKGHHHAGGVVMPMGHVWPYQPDVREEFGVPGGGTY